MFGMMNRPWKVQAVLIAVCWVTIMLFANANISGYVLLACLIVWMRYLYVRNSRRTYNRWRRR